MTSTRRPDTVALPDPEGPSGPEAATCSAKGCPQPATFDLQWNNPKIHTPDRRKHWLACPDHRNSLSAFLSARGFLRDVLPLDEDNPAVRS